MYYKELTELSEEIVYKAIDYIEKNNLYLREATKYYLIVNDKKYPPKEVLKVCIFLIGNHPKEMLNTNLKMSGGNPTNKRFEKLGFKVIVFNENYNSKYSKYHNYVNKNHIELKNKLINKKKLDNKTIPLKENARLEKNNNTFFDYLNMKLIKILIVIVLILILLKLINLI